MAAQYGERHSSLRGWAQLLILVGLIVAIVGVAFAFTPRDGAAGFGAVALAVLGAAMLISGSVFAAIAITLRPDRPLPSRQGPEDRA